MNHFSYLKLFSSLLLTAIISDVKAESDLQFRNIYIGSTLENVKRLARTEFQEVKIEERKQSFGTLAVFAGDKLGMSQNDCAFAATSDLQKNCMIVRFIFSSEVQGNLLDSIFVEQGFNPAIDLDLLTRSLSKSYGAPKLRTEGVVTPTYMNLQSSVTSLVWGGNNQPNKNYRPSTYPYEDREIIGGKYISIAIYHQGNLVNGYTLRVVDSDAASKANQQILKQLEYIKQKRKTSNEESVKF